MSQIDPTCLSSNSQDHITNDNLLTLEIGLEKNKITAEDKKSMQ
jgi:hypothetical protein